MANHLTTPLLIFFIALIFSSYAATASAAVRKMGGRFPVENVDTNQEIQELGRYCVREYNRQLKANGSSSVMLMFSRVVAAEKQVVAGIKYYLEISAATRGGGGPANNFEAVVVVKPWAHSKELLTFAPVTPTSYINIKLSN